MDIVSSSEKETKEIATSVAADIEPGDILALYGDLGSGKTTFTRFLGEALGIEDKITSPTFVIEKRYTPKLNIKNNKEKIEKLIHIDCYRMSEESFDKNYLDEIFSDLSSVIIIEWPDRIDKYLPARTKKIYFKYISAEKRKISY